MIVDGVEDLAIPLLSSADIHRELWRAENPGLSVARGLLFALPVSAAMWAAAVSVALAII